MTADQKAPSGHFLFVGNGPYRNRGCEAIVRGTLEILRHEFGPSVQASSGVYAAADIVRAQQAGEIDDAIRSFTADGMRPRWSRVWWEIQANKRLGTHFKAQHRPLAQELCGARAALQIGGDNYSIYHD